jgi:NAD(P)-dependent dehydrogenase (short-subunit alcohol dehydrogenase family)
VSLLARSQVDAMFGDAVAAMGGLDVLVNNAGITGPTAKVENVSVEGEFRRVGPDCVTRGLKGTWALQ